MLVYPSGLDLSSSALRFLARKLTALRRERGTRWRRLGTDRQALLVLAHLRCGHTYAQLATGFGISFSTVHRYVSEAVELLAALAPRPRRSGTRRLPQSLCDPRRNPPADRPYRR